MRAFIDTSSLIKKYQMEPGRDRLLKILDAIDEILISPVTYIELIGYHFKTRSMMIGPQPQACFWMANYPTGVEDLFMRISPQRRACGDGGLARRK